MLIKKKWPLLAAAGADGGDGAGGGAGGGAGAGGGDGGGTDDVSESTKKFVSQAVNQALSGWSKRLEGKTADLIKNSIAESLKGFQLPPKDDAGGSGGGDDKGTPPPKDDANAKEIAKWRAETEALKSKLAAEERARSEEREARARAEERSALVDELRKRGIPEARIKGAVAYLTHDAKMVRRAEDGSIVWPVKRNGYDDTVPLAEGVAEWLKTDEGKEYMPPQDVGGSGQRGAPKGPAKPGDKYNPDAAKHELGVGILNALGGGGGIFGGGGG